jgi:hypothetical protein
MPGESARAYSKLTKHATPPSTKRAASCANISAHGRQPQRRHHLRHLELVVVIDLRDVRGAPIGCEETPVPRPRCQANDGSRLRCRDAVRGASRSFIPSRRHRPGATRRLGSRTPCRGDSRRFGQRRAGSIVETRRLVVRMANETPTWGYTRIQRALNNVGHREGRSTIARILKAHALAPVPARPTSWQTFQAVNSDQL